MSTIVNHLPTKLSSLLPISNPKDYKVHLASRADKSEPLDDFVQDRKIWDRWNTWRSAKNDFNRPYILALIDFYREPGIWLFGGIYKVLSRGPKNRSYAYRVKRMPDQEDLVGRLKIDFSRPSRTKAVRLEKWFSKMTVAELLKERYTGEAFPGFEDINHDFSTLERIFTMSRTDWKSPLEKIKGVYLIADKTNGKMYVGSAYGEFGVWARWSCYIGTGHGWNDALTKLIHRKGMEYARRNFRISLLEYHPAKTDDNVIIQREKYWKKALLSQEFGYNKN
ncbi:GIY-YIG nuclease family protein [Candidatus Sumerlaeota bacterium]|nr:GIY-YIG nuclease family protein [Candidatus Sumerlaeota bacterium]